MMLIKFVIVMLLGCAVTAVTNGVCQVYGRFDDADDHDETSIILSKEKSNVQYHKENLIDCHSFSVEDAI